MSESERTYLYALARPGDIHVDVRGILSRPVRLVTVGGIGAVVGTVPADLFAAEHVESRVGEAEWVGSLARAHDDVVAAVTRVATAIPLRLGTTADDDENVRTLLSELGSAACRAFDRFEGRAEYGVQVFAPRPRPDASTVEPEAGAAFLRRRRAELQQDELQRMAAAEEGETAYQLLARIAADHRRIPPRDRTSAAGAAMVLNGAFLVDNDAVDSFRAVADQLAASLGPDRVAITGPWAPYSFAELDL